MDILYIIVPCYNEEECLPRTAPLFLAKMESLIAAGLAAPESRILLVNDGSKDKTWEIISSLHAENELFAGLDLCPNRGHQLAVMAGLMEARQRADVSISIDCDLQDDINAMDEMLHKYKAGTHIVCGVRDRRDTDSFLKRFTARAYYSLMNLFGAKLIYDHADYRLLDRDALDRLALYHGDDLFLRGLTTRLGFPWETAVYDRSERMAGESKYTLNKMLKLAKDGLGCGKQKPQAQPRPEDPAIRQRLYR